MRCHHLLTTVVLGSMLSTFGCSQTDEEPTDKPDQASAVKADNAWTRTLPSESLWGERQADGRACAKGKLVARSASGDLVIAGEVAGAEGSIPGFVTLDRLSGEPTIARQASTSDGASTPTGLVFALAISGDDVFLGIGSGDSGNRVARYSPRGGDAAVWERADQRHVAIAGAGKILTGMDSTIEVHASTGDLVSTFTRPKPAGSLAFHVGALLAGTDGTVHATTTGGTPKVLALKDGQIAWEKDFGSGGVRLVSSDYPVLTSGSDGSLFTLAEAADSSGPVVLKLSASGTELFRIKVSDRLPDVQGVFSLAATEDGGVILAGSSHLTSGNKRAPLVAALDAAGELKWSEVDEAKAGSTMGAAYGITLSGNEVIATGQAGDCTMFVTKYRL